jgi:hypothetical protein
MKKLVYLLTGMAALAICTTANASITNVWWAPDADGVLVCPLGGWTNSAGSLTMYGDQFTVAGTSVGHMVGGVQTDSDLDPILNLGGSIENDTMGAWLGYTINVYMNKFFQFGPAFPTVDNPPFSDGWFVAGVGQPTTPLLSGPYTGFWKGNIVYSRGAGTPIAVGDYMDFSYDINFSGGMGFSFVQEMIPSFASIPEPSAFVLAGLGGLMLALRRHRRPAA